MVQSILKNQLVRYLLVLLVGVGIGAVFYPTSRIEEKYEQRNEETVKSLTELHSKEKQKLFEQLDATTVEYKSYREQSEKKIQTLTIEVKTLQSKQKTSFFKLVKPDGTVEVKKFSESEVNESSTVIAQIQEEFKIKIEAIENKWESIHRQRLEEVKKDFQQKEDTYKSRIDELEKSKVVEKNEKSFGLEGGMNTEKQYYIHGTGDLYGPLFMGIHTESDKEFNDKSIGVGLGIKF
jgi:preprotein translocase subunit SecD